MQQFDSHHDVVVIGAGQAGLAMGHHLQRLGLDVVILDGAARLGDTWRSRWDSLILFTPAQCDGLPGLPFPAGADTYPGKDEVAAYLETYAAAFDLPVRLGTRVTQVSRDGDRCVVDTAAGTVSAGQVVMATGPFQTPVIPSVAAGLDPAVVRLHSADYRNPGVLPQGTVLVVGSGRFAEPGSTKHEADLWPETRAARSQLSSPPRTLSRSRSASGCRRSRSAWPAATCSGG